LTLQPLQGKAAASVTQADARINLWEGAVRSSKTTASLVAWLKFIRHAEPGGLLLAGKTQDTVKANVIDPLVEWLGPKRCKYVKGSRELRLLGRRISVVGASTEDAESRIRGRTLRGAYLDEVTLMPASFFKRALSQMSLPGAKMFGTTNPDSPFHWLKTEYIDRAHELHMRHFHFTLEDNPTLTREYVEQLKLEYGGPGTLFYMRFIDGLWVVAEGAIYPQFEVARHVVNVLPGPEFVRSAWVALDYGTTHPFAAGLFLLVDHPAVGEHILLAKEYRYEGGLQGKPLTNPEYSVALKQWIATECRPYVMNTKALPSGDLDRIYVSPDALSFSTQLHRDGFAGAHNADNEVIEGIRGVAGLLAMRKFLVHASCTGTLKEFPGYVWDPKAQKRGEDKPMKVNDDSMDMVRYGLWSRRNLWRHWTSEVPALST
jgi:PBSX family phage terminase large subunit